MSVGETIWFENSRVRVWSRGDGTVTAAAAPCIVVATQGASRGQVERVAAGARAARGGGVEAAVVVELLDGQEAPLGGPTEPTAEPAVRSATYDMSEFASELATVATQTRIGDEVWYEDSEVRVWSISMEPGGRVPFHCHTGTYFWACTDGGSGRQHFFDGTLHWFDFRRGDVDFLDITPDAPVIHDLENVGETQIRFLAVELLGARAAVARA